MSATVDELKRRLADAASGVDVTFKSMFGGACAYAGGKVFASLSDVGLALKLPAAGQAELLARYFCLLSMRLMRLVCNMVHSNHAFSTREDLQFIQGHVQVINQIGRGLLRKCRLSWVSQGCRRCAACAVKKLAQKLL